MYDDVVAKSGRAESHWDACLEFAARAASLGGYVLAAEWVSSANELRRRAEATRKYLEHYPIDLVFVELYLERAALAKKRKDYLGAAEFVTAANAAQKSRNAWSWTG